MRVGLLIDDFFPSSGGIGRSVQTQIDELVRLGHQVVLIAPNRHLEQPINCETYACPTVYIEGLPAHLSVLHHSQRRAKAITHKWRFDLVHSHTDRGALALAARIARLQGIPHVHTFHANIAGTHATVKAALLGTWSYRALVLPALRLATKKRLPAAKRPSAQQEPDGLAARTDWKSLADIAAQVDAWTVPSEFMREIISSCSASNVPGYVVPTGIARGMQEALQRVTRQRDDAKVRFLSVGRLAKEKRIDVMVQAFQRANLPNAELVLVGDGDQLKHLKALAGDDPNIKFLGHKKSLEDIAQELVDADVMVLVSYRFDSQGIVIVEAAAAGLPLLYCDERLHFGISADSAVLTDPDADAIAEGMRVLADDNRRARMRQALSSLQSELLPERTAEKYLDIYRGLVGDSDG